MKILNKSMKKLGFFLSLLFSVGCMDAQPIRSGIYNMGLKVAFDPASHMVSGYVESYSGYDEERNTYSFSCIFFFSGKLENQTAEIVAFYPAFKDEKIVGELQVIAPNKISLQLSDDLPGCWNVLPLVNDPFVFELQTAAPYLQTRWVKIEKSYFHSEKSETTKRKAYVIKNDVVFVERIDQNWAFCSFIGEKATTKGWLKLNELE